jgi:hypothetical protein
MRRTISVTTIVCFFFLFAAFSRVFAQSPSCPPHTALIAANDPAYADAIGLQSALEAHGFVVYCIFPTKLSSAFLVRRSGVAHSTVEGEAAFRTNFGDFGAVFVPKPQNFAELNIKELRKDGGYLYTFSGMPGVWMLKQLGSNRRQFFIKNGNYVLSMSDDKLRDRIGEALAWRAP